jgi:AcrR family transcriptional regulator
MRRPAVSPELLTPEAIAAAALKILQEEGPDALSFRRVAAALGTSHTTIHRHSGSIDGLLDLCADHLAASLPDIDPTLEWATTTELRFTALYKLWTAHADLATLLRGRPWSGPNMLSRFVEPALQSNLAIGMTGPQAIQTFRQMYLFTLGCSSTHAAYDSRQARAIIAALDPDQFPALTAHMDVVAGSTAERDVFLLGLRNLIAAAPHTAPQTAAPDAASTSRRATTTA